MFRRFFIKAIRRVGALDAHSVRRHKAAELLHKINLLADEFSVVVVLHATKDVVRRRNGPEGVVNLSQLFSIHSTTDALGIEDFGEVYCLHRAESVDKSLAHSELE